MILPRLLLLALALPFVLGASGCGARQGTTLSADEERAAMAPRAGTDSVSTVTPFTANGVVYERATFATGCFWCTESDFDKVEGVVSTTSGYTGGHVARVTYEQVGTHRTGHIEAVQVVYDPAKVSYAQLLYVFWRTTDPTDDGGQFCDRGEPYRSAILVHTPAQRAAALASKAEVERTKPFREAIVTEIRPAETFWVAEAYHQDFHETHPDRYTQYRTGCGRDARLRQLWDGR